MKNLVIILICAALVVTGLILPHVFEAMLELNQFSGGFYLAYSYRPVLSASIPCGIAALLFALWYGLQGGTLVSAIDPMLAGFGLSMTGVFYGSCVMNWNASSVLSGFVENWGSYDSFSAGMLESSHQYGNTAKIYLVAVVISLAVFVFFAYRSLREKPAKKKAPAVSQDDLFGDMF